MNPWESARNHQSRARQQGRNEPTKGRKSRRVTPHNERGAEFCRWVVAGKPRNQEKLLRYFARSREGGRREPLERAAEQLRALRKQALACEGVDAVNAGLNYGYGMLHAHVWGG